MDEFERVLKKARATTKTSKLVDDLPHAPIGEAVVHPINNGCVAQRRFHGMTSLAPHIKRRLPQQQKSEYVTQTQRQHKYVRVVLPEYAYVQQEAHTTKALAANIRADRYQ